MNALKIIARALLILLIVSSGFQIALAALGIVVAFQTAADNPRLFGNMVGRLTGSLLGSGLLHLGVQKAQNPASRQVTTKQRVGEGQVHRSKKRVASASTQKDWTLVATRPTWSTASATAKAIESRLITTWGKWVGAWRVGTAKVQKAIAPLFFLAIIGYGLYAFDWNTLSSTTVSDYTLFCREWKDGRCPGDHWVKEPRSHVDYIVHPEQQVVIRQWSGEPPDRLSNCVVVDRKNWKCQQGSLLTDGARRLIGYTDGEFWDGMEDSRKMFIKFPSAEGVKHVSRLEWLLADER